MPENKFYDVIVVGGGNAALCAAITARNEGSSVLVLERAPIEERGGNSTFTDGKFRAVYNGVEDVCALVPDLTEEEIECSDFGEYTEADFYDDMTRLTQFRTDPDLCETLVTRSRDALFWLKENGIRFMPNYGRQAYRVNGRFKFWGGTTLVVADGGPGLVDGLYRRAEKLGIEVRYESPVQRLVHDVHNGVTGVEISNENGVRIINCGAVVLACGGFEANTEWRARYLGPGWDLAKVRGSRFNTGDGLSMALDIGAQPFGHWSGCHATSWERYAADFGNAVDTPQYQRHSYTFGIVVNTEGKRFLDEGADFRNYTYAKYGELVLKQPGQVAWQIYDGKMLHLLTDEYRTRQVTKIKSETIEGLISQMDEVNQENLLKTIKEYNSAVDQDTPFDANSKDGRSARGLEVARSNWANTLDTPPFEAYAVTCGITFTFGGIKIGHEGQVIDTNGKPISGLFAAGEMVGGIFYFNYPGASGLTSGTVFGRLAGEHAAKFAASSE